MLVADNTYAGGTIINAGTLQLGNGGTTGSIIGNVLNNGILAFNRSGSVIFDGLISGIGALAKLGSGTLALPNSNAYGGGTTILGGTILTQNASAFGTGPVTFGNGGALQVQDLLNVNGNWTVSPGVASVSGGTVQTFGDFNLGGGGTLIVNSNFNVPGTANINSSGFVVNSAFTANDDINLNGSAAAVINGLLISASVNVNNTSSLIVNNPGSVTGNVNVGPSASLGVFGRINGSIFNAGFFQGTGVVNGNVFSSGTVSPGASLGTLTINGNYTQSATGTLRIEVAGTSAGQHDVLAVQGRANVAGRLQFVPIGGFKLRIGDQIVFLTASNGVSGTFGTVNDESIVTGTIVMGELVYGPGGVFLEGTQGSFEEVVEDFEKIPDVVLPPNSSAVAQALDSLIGDPRAAALLEFLNGLPVSELPRAFQQISPDELTSINVVGVSLANVQSNKSDAAHGRYPDGRLQLDAFFHQRRRAELLGGLCRCGRA